MNKMKAIIGIVIVLFIACIGTLIFFSHNETKILSPLSNSKPTPQDITSGLKSLTEYFDPSGFEFKYPRGLIINNKNPSDNSIYSSLEITSSSNSGMITILAKTTDLTNIDDWFKKNKDIKSSGVNKLKLADDDARQFKTNNQTTTIALDQGVLFTLISSNNEYWQKVNKSVIDSFAFIQPTGGNQSSDNSSGSSNQSSGDVVDEGEEVVQ